MSKTKASLEKVKKELLERRAELEAELIRLSNEELSDGQSQDTGDQAFASTSESLRMALQHSEHGEYDRILKALDSIENGTYGVCVDCDAEISDKRLKHYPDASRCITCQEAAEEQL